MLDVAAGTERKVASGTLSRPPFVDDREFAWSPDGRWIAYASNDGSKRFTNVFIVSADGGTPRQAIEFYTRNNAYILSMDEWTGSLEPGKRADFIVLDRDLLTCPPDEIAKTNVLATYMDGRLVYEKK